MIVDFLGIRIFHQIAFRGSFLFVENLKLYLTMYLRSCWLRKHPGGVEILNMADAGHNTRLKSAGGQYHEVMSKRWILGFQHREVEFQMDESCHQEGFASTHWQAKNIVGVAYTIKNIAESLFVIDCLRMILNELLHLRC